MKKEEVMAIVVGIAALVFFSDFAKSEGPPIPLSAEEALYAAACTGEDGIVRAILAKEKVDINHQGTDAETALFCAVKNGHKITMTVLLKFGANANIRTKDGMTPIMAAAVHERTAMMQELISHGADKDMWDGSGCTALMHSAKNGHAGAIELLAREWVNLERKENMTGDTALILAARHGHTDVVRALLTAGARKDAKNLTGETARDVAEKNKHKEVLKLL